MPILLKAIAAIAAVSVPFTLVLIATVIGSRGVPVLLRSGPLGILTMIGWAVTLGIGPYAALQLWRLKERGRIAGLILFGFGVVYYVVGFFWLRTSEAQWGPILAALIGYAVPLVILMSPSARRACS